MNSTKNYPPGTWSATLSALMERGLRIASAIDVGSADGHFSAFMFELGLFRDTRILNVDANPIYLPSLEKLKRAIGAEYAVCAVGETSGQAIFTQASHPYWGSMLPPSDPYWSTVNNLSAGQVGTEVRTIDSLVSEHCLPPPYIIKMDIQGSEAAALKGATRTLERTAVIIIEIMVEEFDLLYRALSNFGFCLHDITYINRRHNGSLSWFYPVFVHRQWVNATDHAIWQSRDNAAIIAANEQRRARMIEEIDRSLSRMRSAGVISGNGSGSS